MPKAFLINRHRIKRDNYRNNVPKLLSNDDADYINEEIESIDIEDRENTMKNPLDESKENDFELEKRFETKLADFQEDYLYNLKRLAEITLAYFNYQDNRHGEEKTKASRSENYRCWDCGKSYSTSSNLARHRQTHRSLEDKKAKHCEHCGKVYVSIPAYSMHIRTHVQNCKCNICGKCFSRPWLLQGHIRTHTGEKPFKCSVCNKAFADKSNLRAHVQTHSSAKPFTCHRCGKSFTLKSYLYKHEESSCVDMKKETTAQIILSSEEKQIPNLQSLSNS